MKKNRNKNKNKNKKCEQTIHCACEEDKQRRWRKLLYDHLGWLRCAVAVGASDSKLTRALLVLHDELDDEHSDAEWRHGALFRNRQFDLFIEKERSI